MSSYGFNVNASAVTNEDGNISVGINFKDTEGFKFDTSEEGKTEDVVNNIYQKFLTQYITAAAQSKADEEKPKVQEAKPSEDMIGRLRKLERENADLKAQIASAKYKNPKYNKPEDTSVTSKVTTKYEDAANKAVDDAFDRAAARMKKRLKEDQTTPLKDMFSSSSSVFDDMVKMLDKTTRRAHDDFWLF